MATAVKQKRAALRGKLPTKRSINFASVGEKPINWLVAIPAIMVILVLAALLGKVAVVDRYMALSRAQSRAADMQAQVDAGYARVDAYGELVDEYAHYTYSGMTAEELALVDRVAVMDMLERVVMPQATLNSWTLSNNQLSLPVTGATLERINSIAQQLQAEDMVDFCTVTTASTNQITVKDDVATGGDVTAQITVYLKNNTSGEGAAQ